MAPQKRSAGNAMSPKEGPTRTEKKRRQSVHEGDPQSAEFVLEKGHEFLEAIYKSKDKSDDSRPTADRFKTRASVSQYGFMFCLEDLETKLRNGEYSDLTSLEADFKRIVHDARSRAAGGDIRDPWHRDAERLRKTASNWMRSYNPAYNNPQYDCKPTPRLDELPRRSNRGANASRQSLTPADVAVSEPEEDAEPADDEADAMDTDVDFTGKSFQEAQEHLVESLINYHDEDGLNVFEPFKKPVSKADFPDYYEMIEHVTALQPILSRIQGRARGKRATGVSEFQTWDELTQEMSYIWINCRLYNKDNSDIVHDVKLLEDVFNTRLAEAKAKAPEPRAPSSLRINMPRSEGPSSGGSGLKLDLRRRSTPATVEKTDDSDRAWPSAVGDHEDAPVAVQAEPSEDDLAEARKVEMAPPTQPPMSPNDQLMTRTIRPEGKTVADALVTSLRFQTHHHLVDVNRKRGVEPWKFDVRPNNESCFVQLTTHVPCDHYWIKMTTRLAKLMVDGSRPNNRCMFLVHPENPNLPPSGYETDADGHRHPWWELHMTPGCNTVRFFVLAGPSEPQEPAIATRGSTNPSRPEQFSDKFYYPDEIDIERFTVFLYLCPPTADAPGHIRQQWGMYP